MDPRVKRGGDTAFVSPVNSHSNPQYYFLLCQTLYPGHALLV